MQHSFRRDTHCVVLENEVIFHKTNLNPRKALDISAENTQVYATRVFFSQYSDQACSFDQLSPSFLRFGTVGIFGGTTSEDKPVYDKTNNSIPCL